MMQRRCGAHFADKAPVVDSMTAEQLARLKTY